MPESPKVSIVVVVFRIPRQAARALSCLTPVYQRHVRPEDYEVIVVENDSPDLLGEDAVRELGRTFRYVHRKDPRPSPAFALTIGVSQARARHVGVVLDGAHLLTPRVLEFALLAQGLARRPVVMVPPYHLGERPQHLSNEAGYDEVREAELLKSVAWPEDPYRLFNVSVAAPGTKGRLFLPLPEAGAVFCRRADLVALRPEYQRFVDPGGGALATYLLGELCRLPAAEPFILAGEGAFHQFHGGVYTSARPDRRALLARRAGRLASVAGSGYRPSDREPRVLGVVTGHAQRHVRTSARTLARFAARSVTRGVPLWSPD